MEAIPSTSPHLLGNGTQVQLGQFVPVNSVGTNFAGTIALSWPGTRLISSARQREWGMGATAGINGYGTGLVIEATLTPTNGTTTISTNAPPKVPATNGVYDLAADFSGSSNPNGVWSYGGYFCSEALAGGILSRLDQRNRPRGQRGPSGHLGTPLPGSRNSTMSGTAFDRWSREVQGNLEWTDRG